MTTLQIVSWHFSLGDVLVLAGLMVAAGVAHLLQKITPAPTDRTPLRSGGYPSRDGAGTMEGRWRR